MHTIRTKHPRFIRRSWLTALVLLAGLIALTQPTATWAHPLGNFTINRYSRLELGTEQARLFYIVDMAEIPAFQEVARIDTDSDSVISSIEQERYLTQQIGIIQGNLSLNVGGSPVTLVLDQRELQFPEGQGGLKTIRFSAWFTAALPESSAAWQATYRDDNFADRLGWKEIVVRATSGVTLLNSSAPAEDISRELREYPQDLLQSPLDVTTADFSFQPGPTASGSPVAGAASPANLQSPISHLKSVDQFTELITTPLQSPLGVPAALAIAFGLGAAHALSPGHGKTIVAAYLVGARGTARHALFLGLTTTITHTAGVFALGIVTLFVSAFILPEQLYPWLGVLSGVAVFAIGATLLRMRLSGVRGQGSGVRPGDTEIGRHGDRETENGRRATNDGRRATGDGRRTTDNLQSPTHHDALDQHGGHDHGFGYHTHTLPDATQQTVSWRGLLALGVSGGIIPCPSALVVLLSAIALGRVGFGLLLVVAFSLGLAAVLTAIGMLLVYAGRLFERIPIRGRLFRVVPIAGALVVTVAGLGITLQALLQTGLLTL
jgi:ABC-type nickel/cobalt efflux system permease component RcnA